MTKRPTFEDFRREALEKPGVKDEYDALSTLFEMKRQMIAMRKKAGLTQEQIADLLGTKKSNISRLESLNSGNMPRVSTLQEYARVLGYKLKVGFEPRTR